MIKITQLLKDSFLTYKSNFSKIFWIALPILILGIIGEYCASVFTKMLDNNDFSNMSSLIINFALYFIAILAVSLYFGPVINRAIQKKEDGAHFNTNAAYNFQKKNIFKWIMVNIWGFLYMVWVMLPYIVVGGLLTAILFIYGSNTILSLIVSSLMVLTLLLGIILNIHKFVVYKNVFFSKDEVSARDAVRESIKLGVHKKGQVWMLILTLIISTIAMLIIYFAIGFILGLIGKSFSDNVMYFVEMILSGLISTLLFLPLMSIIMSKGYVKIRG